MNTDNTTSKRFDLNKKKFLVPNCKNSMAAAHIKLYNSEERKEYQMRISDCNKTIKLWGYLSEEGLEQGIEKMSNLIALANELKTELTFLLNQSKQSL